MPTLRLTTTSNIAASIRAEVRFRTGVARVPTRVLTVGAGIIESPVTVGGGLPMGGSPGLPVENIALDALVETSVLAVARGQVYAQLGLHEGDELKQIICRGYVYDGKPLMEGENVEPGPGGGEGSLSWVSLAADIAPVDITRVLAATGVIRKIHGFALYYNRAAGAGDVTINVTLRRPGLAVPTGFAGVGNIWLHPGALTLSSAEEGMLYADEKLIVGNDAGTISTASTATAPGPFPYLAKEDDLAELFFDVASPISGDVWSVYLKQEEWVIP